MLMLAEGLGQSESFSPIPFRQSPLGGEMNEEAKEQVLVYPTAFLCKNFKPGEDLPARKATAVLVLSAMKTDRNGAKTFRYGCSLGLRCFFDCRYGALHRRE